MSLIHPYYQANYNFCPRCGAKFLAKETPLQCQNCGFEVYANPAPTSAVIIEQNGKILLAIRKNDPKKGTWDTPGGFIEPNESLEESVIREVKEETGLTVKVIGYIASAPIDYEQKPTLTIGVHAQIVSGTMKPADDVASLHWVSLDEIPENIGFDSVRMVIEKFKTQQKNK